MVDAIFFFNFEQKYPFSHSMSQPLLRSPRQMIHKKKTTAWGLHLSLLHDVKQSNTKVIQFADFYMGELSLLILCK